MGENKLYRKKILAAETLCYFYDEEMRNVMVVTANSISQLRNDGNNNFNAINNIYFHGFSKIISARFCKSSKYFTLLTADLLLYQFQNYETRINKCYQLQFNKSPDNIVEGSIVDYHYCS